jgi:hypothetical protein
VYAVKKTAAIAKFRLNEDNTRVDRGHNRTSIQSLYGVGAEDTSRKTPFVKENAPMELDSQEKRCDARFSCRAPVEWAYFNKVEKHSARMLNNNQTGACFECSDALMNGATIMFRLEAYWVECEAGCKEG